MTNKKAVLVVFFFTYIIYVVAQAMKNFFPKEVTDKDGKSNEA